MAAGKDSTDQGRVIQGPGIEGSAIEAAAIEVRVLDTHEAFRATLAVQVGVWKFSDVDQIPPRILSVAKYIGGLVLGAYDGEKMIGFSFALPGGKADGSRYWHSHMTGVLGEYQNRGIGRMLKLKQRQEALAAGVSLIEWFFDPLEIRNAHFNIERLGAIARTFLPNQYGITSSPLHGGMPTDRLVAEWRLASPRVLAIHSGPEPKPKPEPRRVEKTIEIPAQISDLRSSDQEKAKAIQRRVREQFQEYFGMGLAVTGYQRGGEGGRFELGRLTRHDLGGD